MEQPAAASPPAPERRGGKGVRSETTPRRGHETGVIADMGLESGE
jgi:hypothetical protein